MKKTVTFWVFAAAALSLAACSGNTAPEPEAEPAAEAAPADDATAVEAATAGAEGTDPNSNPVGPAAAEAPAEAPAAE